jgi:hypothetical protein
VRVRPVSPAALRDELADRIAGARRSGFCGGVAGQLSIAGTGGWLRVCIDGPPPAPAGAGFAEA